MDERIKNMNNELMQRLVWLNRFHTEDKIYLLNALKDKFGGEVVDVVEKAETKKAFDEWSKIAKNSASNSIEDFIKLLWEPLRSKGFEFTFEKENHGVRFNCTRCPIYDLAKELKGTDWMYHHTCNTDFAITEGFNPKIKLKRTKTLMQGDNCCNHFYYYED